MSRLVSGSSPAVPGTAQEVRCRPDPIRWQSCGAPSSGSIASAAIYERHKPELLKMAEGKFVVIVGDELVGPLETDEEAERAGYARFGLGPLYIKQVLAEEPPALITRDVVPCRT